LAVAIDRVRGESSNDDVWPEGADDRDEIGEQCVVMPLLEGVSGRTRATEVVGAREELFATVNAPRSEDLFSMNGAQRETRLDAGVVRAALAA
jgi:hypothetical protein